MELRPANLVLSAAFFGMNGVAAAEEDRVVVARRAHEQSIRARCVKVGLPYPPRELFLRALKREGEVEVWAREDREQFRPVAVFPVTAGSGAPGPKRRQGDQQIPEGCYRISVFNPRSKFHLSLGLDYPNASDRVRADREHPGTDIYIHGSNRSRGCLPLGDEAIEELYLLALDVRARGQQELPVHIFPMRMRGEAWEAFRAQHAALGAFWSELQPIYDAFETTRLFPRVMVTAAGAYRLVR